jgi:TonB family protein
VGSSPLARDVDGVNGKPPRALRARFDAVTSDVARVRTQARQRITPALQNFNSVAKAQGVLPIDLPADAWIAPEATTPWAGASAADVQIAALPCSASEIDFDSMGAEFGPWLRTFLAQLKRNWVFPPAVASFSGCVVVTFAVHRDGKITDVAVATPSRVAAFNQSAKTAVLASNPTAPLPTDYPEERCLFQVTFGFNWPPVKRQ